MTRPTKKTQDALPRTNSPPGQSHVDDSDPGVADYEHDRMGPHKADEIDTILEIMAECITSLFRMASLVNAPRSGDRFARAWLVGGRYDNESSMAEEIDLVRQRFPKLRKDHSNDLLHRLALAMKKRRAFIDFGLRCQTHADNGKQKQIQSQPATEANSLEDEEQDNDVSKNMNHTITDPLTGVSLPSLAELSADQKTFECPICFTSQRFPHEISWRYVGYPILVSLVTCLQVPCSK